MLAVALMAAPSALCGQALPDSAGIEAWFEAAGVDRDIDEAVIQDLEDALANPIELNRATVDALAELPLLSPVLARAIVEWRTRHGAFERIEDLLRVPLFPAALLDALRAFVVVDDTRRTPAHTPLQFSAVLNYRRLLDPVRGFSREDGYEGPPAGRYARLQVRRPRLFTARVVLENDPGERLRWAPPAHTYGFDHVSGFVAFETGGWLSRLVAGDFRVEAGQGLLLWSPFGRGKGIDPTGDPIRRARGIRPAASREELFFFRGVAAEAQLPGRIRATGFVSRRALDAAVEPAGVTALRTAGLHRTPAERAGKGMLRATTYGALVGTALGALELGVIGYEARFDRPFLPDPAPAARFDFAGRRLRGLSVHGSATLANVYAWGEVAVSRPGAPAAIAGVFLQPHRSVETVLLWRHYAPAHHSVYGVAFSETRSSPHNETGYYAALVWRAGSNWEAAGYIDTFRFPWVRRTTRAPARGRDAFARLTYAPRTWLSAYVQYRTERKDAPARYLDAAGRLLHIVRPAYTRSVRAQVDYRFSRRLALRTRIEHKVHRGIEKYVGVLVYQDAIIERPPALKLHLRLAIFDAPAHPAAVYAYENDVRYQPRILAFTGNGARYFIILRYTFGSHLTVEARYGTTRFATAVERGSGLDAFSGNRIREINTQLTWHI